MPEKNKSYFVNNLPIICSVIFPLFCLAIISQVYLFPKKNLGINIIQPTKKIVASEINEVRLLNIQKPIYRLSVTGSLNLLKDYSYFRVILIDKNNKEYLVYENYPLITSSNNSSFSNSCEETCILDKVLPKSLRIEGSDSTYSLTKISYEDKPDKLLNQTKTINIASQIIETNKNNTLNKIRKINQIIKNKKLRWTAGETSISKMTYTQKKKLFSKPDGTPVDSLPNLQGFEYYKGGIFEIKSANTANKPQVLSSGSSSYPLNWDWRNKYGQNWLTSVKDQGPCGSCWIFGPVAVVEANTNLYFNSKIDPDLSEQEILSCGKNGNCSGGYPATTLQYIQDNGVSNEQCFPYQASQVSCLKCTNNVEKISIKGFYNNNLRDNVSILKYLLMNKGVFLSGIYSWAHTMPVVGWETDTYGTIWIFKNSWGVTWGENGYARIKMPVSDMGSTYSIDLPVSISNSSQQINCTDNDQDGYCYWGLSTDKPSTCPAFCKPEKDCDDSNPNLQISDAHFNCLSINDITPTPSPTSIPLIPISITLNSGLNMVSFPLEAPTENQSPSIFFKTLIDEKNLEFVQTYTNGNWTSYFVNIPPLFNTLKSIQPSVGYWVKVNKNTTFTYSGININLLKVPLITGWNLIGTPDNYSVNLPNLIDPLSDKIESVWSFQNEQWKKYIPTAPADVNNLSLLEGTKAYWIKATQATNFLFYPTSNLDKKTLSPKSNKQINLSPPPMPK